VFIKDMVLTPEMQSDLATAAKNKRIAEAKVISAKADVESAKLMRESADFLDNKAAMQIRFLETLQLIAKGPNPKIMFLPLSAHSTAAS
jgi:regulator of protease activity HflC (stomatin/prohibitin superfamily)